MGRKKRGRAAKHARATQATKHADEFVKIPHSFVFHRGSVGHSALQLVKNVRTIMEPFTARNLKVQKKNVLRDFVTVAGPLGVTHLLTFSRTELSLNLRLIRLPRGPTLTFKIKEYALSKDVVSSLKRPLNYQAEFNHHPLLVMNNFKTTDADGKELRHMKLVQTMFQNLFPSININSADLRDVRRCVLLNYNSTTDCVELRHYTIKAVPSGVSRSAKKLVQSKIPNLSRYKDISEYLLQPGQLSESEYEDGGANEVVLPQGLSTRGCRETAQCAVRLVELGPRITMKLYKIEDGVADGEVMYHAFVRKTKKEVVELRRMREQKMKLKARRRREQEANVRRKQRSSDADVKAEVQFDEEGEAAEHDDANEEDEEGDVDRPAEEPPSMRRTKRRETASTSRGNADKRKAKPGGRAPSKRLRTAV